MTRPLHFERQYPFLTALVRKICLACAHTASPTSARGEHAAAAAQDFHLLCDQSVVALSFFRESARGAEVRGEPGSRLVCLVLLLACTLSACRALSSSLNTMQCTCWKIILVPRSAGRGTEVGAAQL
jgi:hypothetical protein